MSATPLLAVDTIVAGYGAAEEILKGTSIRLEAGESSGGVDQLESSIVVPRNKESGIQHGQRVGRGHVADLIPKRLDGVPL